MVSANKLIVDFDRKFDRFASQYKKNLRLVDKVSAINEALQIFLEDRMSLAETNEEVRTLLRPLEMKEVTLPILSSTDSYVIAELPKDMAKRLRQRVQIEKEGCGTKEIPVIIFQTDDLNKALINPYWKPSYKWETSLGDEGSEGLYIWHGGDHEIKKVIIDYYKIHPDVHAPEMSINKKYIDWNGEEQTTNSDLLISDDRKVSDIAVLVSRADLGDVRDFELKLKQALTLNKINF